MFSMAGIPPLELQGQVSVLEGAPTGYLWWCSLC